MSGCAHEDIGALFAMRQRTYVSGYTHLAYKMTLRERKSPADVSDEKGSHPGLCETTDRRIHSFLPLAPSLCCDGSSLGTTCQVSLSSVHSCGQQKTWTRTNVDMTHKQSACLGAPSRTTAP